MSKNDPFVLDRQLFTPATVVSDRNIDTSFSGKIIAPQALAATIAAYCLEQGNWTAIPNAKIERMECGNWIDRLVWAGLLIYKNDLYHITDLFILYIAAHWGNFSVDRDSFRTRYPQVGHGFLIGPPEIVKSISQIEVSTAQE